MPINRKMAISSVNRTFYKCFNFLIILLMLNVLSICTNGHNSTLPTGIVHIATAGDLQVGPLTQDQSLVDITNISPTEYKPLAANVTARLVKHDRHQTNNSRHDVARETATRRPATSGKKRPEVLSTDCFAKRNEILNKRGKSSGSRSQPPLPISIPAPANFQKLRPNGAPKPAPNLNESLIDSTSNANGEHVPQCTSSGAYEPIQCHNKIGYCWCVNKFGQAIRNSAIMLGQKLHCDSVAYESEGNDLLVVTGVSASRMKNFIKPSISDSSSSSGSDSDSDSDPDSPSFDQEGRLLNKGDPKDEFSRRVSASEQPLLALVPNECSMSRANARERASKHTLYNDSIWIPECDSENDKLYADKQCHKSSICWCVDPITGLPSSSGDQLGKQQAALNCLRTTPLPPSTFFNGFSKLCEADKRYDFLLFLINQFRNQLSEYKLLNPSSTAPDGLTSLNPYGMNQAQVSKWKFATLDLDLDGKLDDREWSKFKNNFKLVNDDFERSQRYNKQQSHSLSPLNIPRNQRGCWRDFLQFCGNGDLITDDSISLTKWLSCTELPSKSNLSFAPAIDRGATNARGTDSATESIYEYLKAAARSKKKNPFLGILKPN